MMVKVSVLLPIYNGAKTLAKTLDSLVAQSFENFEVIACIDGTSDGSENILNDYKFKFKRLKVLRNAKNLGLGSTMNRLVSNANGEFLAIAEQDDFYYPLRFEKQVDILESMQNIGMVSGIAEFCDKDKVVCHFPGMLVNGNNYPVGKDMFLLNYKKQIKVVNSCLMFRKSIHVNYGLYFTQHYPSIGVDWTYILRFSLISDIYGLNEILVKLDRDSDRNSVTKNHVQMNLASRELIRSMAYEKPDIITKNDFKYAMNTQTLLEWGRVYGLSFYVTGLYYLIRYYNDNRFRDKFRSRVLKKLI